MLFFVLRCALVLWLLLSGCAGPSGEDAKEDVLPAAQERLTELASDGGHFQVSFTSELDPITINQLHRWTLQVADKDGTPVEGATITVKGEMPEHGHGMPTQPQVTADLGGGIYQVEGMRFQMGGGWSVTFTIEADGVQDSVTFQLKL
ncbi:MAG: FixH family protein [Caldilinea sp.]|jgi:hypothetical protein